MSNFPRKLLLQTRSPIIQFQRFRGKINIQRPQKPHYERARVLAVTQPIYPEKKVNINCFKKYSEINPTKILDANENPYNKIIAREALNWLNHSKMVGIFHVNSIKSDEMFKVRVALHKENMHLKVYGKKIIQMAVENTKYETIVPLFESNHCIIFSSEEKLTTLIKITKKIPQMILLGGIVSDILMSRNEMINYSKLPDLKIMQSQLVGVLNMAGGQLVNHLEAHQKGLVNILDVYGNEMNSIVSKDENEKLENSTTPIETKNEDLKPKE